jgi:hypothetical protein
MDGKFIDQGLELPEPDFTLPNGAIGWRAVEQGSWEWLMLRAGVPTASELSSLLVKPKDPKKAPHGLGAGAITYAHTIAAERIIGGPVSAFQGNEHTERGHRLEGELADNYALLRGVDLDTVGFIRRGRFGYSPDRLVGANGLLEVKAPTPPKVIGMLRDPDFPGDYRAQCLGGLYATDREWIDIVVGAQHLPECIRRLDHERVRSEVDALKDALERFIAYVDDTVAFVHGLYGDGPEAAAIAASLPVSEE